MLNKSLGLLVGSIMLAGSVQAQTHYYSFKVKSAGAGIYACNAGVRTQLNNCDTCYQTKASGATESVPRPSNSCAPSDLNCNRDVICAHRGANTGEALVNYLTVTAGTYNNGNISSTAKISKIGGTSYNSVALENNSFVTHVGNDLEFKLTSELYTAQYFVDICFQGPAIDTSADGVGLNYNIQAIAGSSELLTPAADRYTTRAGLKSQAFMICDFGTSSTAASNTANYTTGANGLPTNAGWVSAPIDVTTDMHKLLEIPAVLNPKFCKVRYVFTETKGLNCNGGKSAFRDLGLKTAEICLQTDFNEPQ